MLEGEIRQYLSTFTKKIVGTAGAVEDAMNVCFDDAKLVEWFDDRENLKRGMFNIDVNLKDDLNLKYDDRLFLLSTKLLNNAKNIRSKLNSFNIKINSAGRIDCFNYSVTDIKLSSEPSFEYQQCDLFLAGQSTSTIALNNSLMLDFDSSGDIKTSNGGVMAINLNNALTFENEVAMHLNITGGVTWVF
jgi:hypothetical protein